VLHYLYGYEDNIDSISAELNDPIFICYSDPIVVNPNVSHNHYIEIIEHSVVAYMLYV
jgi:hypothetical protein